jgi:hypothetical protein
MIMKKNIFLLTFLFFVLSCKKNEDLEKIDSDILVELGNDDSGIILFAQSERIYTCSNYQLVVCHKMRKDEIYVGFENVKSPEVCLTSLGPAACVIELGKLEAGDYTVTFELNRKKTKGRLKVGASAELDLDAGGNVRSK